MKKTMLKKLIAIIMGIAIIFVFTSCKDDDANSYDSEGEVADDGIYANGGGDNGSGYMRDYMRGSKLN